MIEEYAGVIDQQIDAAEPGRRFANQPPAFIGLGQVCGQRDMLAAWQFGKKVVQFLSVAVSVQRETSAFFCQRAGCCPANTAAGAGD